MQPKRISKFLILVTAISQFIFPQTVFASFPDVPDEYKNSKAILYLQENGIIKGYPDGTFKPDNLVNRAEFLKIVIEGSGIITNTEVQTPFIDTDDNEWYAPYVEKAYTSGWIQGYTDGTFRPSQTITKVEALKILGKAQSWTIPETVTVAPFTDAKTTDWFTPYVTFAKEKELLEETGKLLFPNEEMSRAKISEVVYRTIIKGLSIIVESKTPAVEPIEPTPETPIIEPEVAIPITDTSSTIDFSPVTESQIPSGFYTNISLDSPLPNTFYKNEIYLIKGSITSGTYEEATVILADITFSEKVSNNHFEIPVIFRNTGNFSLGILPGDSGKTKLQTISVLPTLPSLSSNDTTPLKLTPEIKFSNGKTSVNFKDTSSTIKRLRLSQGSNSVIYLSRQSTNEISVFYRDFKNFSQSQISYYMESAKISSSSPLIISSGFSTSETKTFSPTYHTFSDIDTNTQTSSIPETMSSPSNISFTVTPSVQIETEAFATKPDGFVEELTLSKNGNNYTYSYTPQSSGTYIVEVNNAEGIAIINHPIYIGNKIPILPDFFDKNDRQYFKSTVVINTMRNELLNKINESRKAQGLSEVVLSDELNNLAQIHSDDMSQNNYFSHMDSSGNMPEDRRKNLGILTPVSENLVKETSIIFGHESLMRSGTHRSNILEKDWTRVGIGITKTQNDGGYLLITEEFSTDTITPGNLTSMKQELFTKINEKRTTNSVTTLIQDTNIDNASKFLNDKTIKENITLTDTVFSDALNSFNIVGQSELIGRAHNLWSTILNSFLSEEPSLTTGDWTKIGIDIQTDLSGIINALIIINK